MLKMMQTMMAQRMTMMKLRRKIVASHAPMIRVQMSLMRQILMLHQVGIPVI